MIDTMDHIATFYASSEDDTEDTQSTQSANQRLVRPRWSEKETRYLLKLCKRQIKRKGSSALHYKRELHRFIFHHFKKKGYARSIPSIAGKFESLQRLVSPTQLPEWMRPLLLEVFAPTTTVAQSQEDDAKRSSCKVIHVDPSSASSPSSSDSSAEEPLSDHRTWTDEERATLEAARSLYQSQLRKRPRETYVKIAEYLKKNGYKRNLFEIASMISGISKREATE